MWYVLAAIVFFIKEVEGFLEVHRNDLHQDSLFLQVLQIKGGLQLINNDGLHIT